MSDSEDGSVMSDDGGKSDVEEEVGSGGSMPGSPVASGGESPIGSPADSPVGSPVGSPIGSPAVDEDDDARSDAASEAEEVPEGEEGEIIEGAEEDEEEGEDLDQIDDEDEEEEEEEEEEDDFEEDDGGPSRKKRRKKTGGIMDFILQEADVDEDGGEDEDEDGWEEGAKDLIDREPAEIDDNELHGAHRLQQIWSQENEKEIEEYYRRKYAETSSGSGYAAEEELPNAITQQGLLPGVKDPNLWMVKCRVGEEKTTALLLMRKFLAYQYQEEPLQIKSIVAPEGIKGMIYVEAYKQTHVKQAITGVSNLRYGQWKQQMVPIKEMTDVLRVVKETAILKPKSWVRLKRGIYKGDLAQVDYFEPSQNQVTLKIIPRIDYTKPRGVIRKALTDQEKKRKRKPAAKLFDQQAIRAIGGEVTTDGDFLVFEGNRFSRKGFMYKTLALSAIIYDGVKPTLSELEKFDDKPEKLDIQLAPQKTTGSEVTHNFAPGDMVQVAEGELLHLQGQVITIDGNNITILPRHEDLKDLLEFPAHELQKFFQVGDHVKVIEGRHEGDTGLIVRVEDNVVFMVSDLTMDEIKVAPKTLQLCQEMGTGVDSMGQFSLQDLVQLDPQTVGVIVRLEKESMQVLNIHGKLVHVKPQALTKRKENRNALALDAEQNSIQSKDIVKVVDGPHSGRQGQIRHVFRSYIFLHSRLMTENGGMFVCRARHVVLAGGKRADSTQSSPGLSGMMSPRISSPMHPSSGGQGRGGAYGGGPPRVQRDRTLIGQTVRITEGPYKGYIGIIKDATDSTVRLELHSMMRTISVDRNRVAVLGQKGKDGSTTSYGRTPMYGSQTPMYGSGSRTPLYGSQTPIHDGSRTPHYGSQTPLHEGSQTPGRSGAWDPSVSNTPMRQSDSDFSFDESSPSPQPYGSTIPSTPGYSPDTPQSGSHYNPGTPGGSSGMYGSDTSYSPYQPTPSPGNYQPTPSPSGSFQQVSSPGSYQPTPSPQGYQHSSSPSSFHGSTPSPSSYPLTPGAPSPLGFNPATPGMANPLDPSQTEWQTVDIEVKIKESHEDANLIYKHGVIRGMSGPMCSIYLLDEDRIVNVQSEHLEPVMPAKTDRVKVITGEDRESTGVLINIDGEDGIVKMDLGQADIKILSLNSLAKLHEK